ncbi:MAG: cytochrome P450 [Actinomycetota bacterium]|jgi:cytochrome P450|nr:cytochrome P450 [Actinomycetota bacterium]
MPAYDPIDVQYALDPWPLYDRLRSEAPIHRSPRGFWVLSRHADCLSVLRDRRASADSSHLDPERLPDGFAVSRERASVISDMVDQAERDNRPFLFRDPPDHTRLRGLVSKAFTPRMVEGLRGRTEEIVTELLDQGLERGEIDAVADFAYPLPVRIICDMLGVPAADQARFPAWSAALARGLDPEFLLTDDVRQARMDALVAFAEYFFELLADRRLHPGPDLLSQLALAEDGGDTLSEGELLSTAILLLVAGHETTVNLIGGSVLALIDHPDQMSALRDDPTLARSGVEELLRYVSPVQLTGRTMTDDIRVGGEVLGRGEFAVLLIASANRDPEAFETAGTLVLSRSDNRHLGFGFGIHHCLGAPLARLETHVALTELLRRAAKVELATGEVEYRSNVVLRGLAELPVRLVPA